jgi:TPR repeat protein
MGSATGCNKLGSLYEEGKGIVNRSKDIALKFYTTACELNFSDACKSRDRLAK